MKCALLLLVAFCVTFSVQGRSIQGEEHLDTRNEIWDKFLENLIKAKENAAEKLQEAAKVAKEVAEKALKAWEELKAKLDEAKENGEEMSMGLVARVKAAILAEFQKVKPIIANLKAQAKEEIEHLVQQIKESDAVANVKEMAEKVKNAINNLVDHIPDYEQMLMDKFEEVKSILLENAKFVKAKLIQMQDEAEQKIRGLIIVAQTILKEEIEPKIKAEVEELISLAKDKLDEAREKAAVIADKLEEKIESIMEVINDKTGQIADGLIKKYEAELKVLIAVANNKIDDIKSKADDLMDKIQARINEALGDSSASTFGSKTDAIVDKVMDMLEGPLSKLPSSIRLMVSTAIEKALRFGCTAGKSMLIKLLDVIGDSFGPSVKGITEMAKLALSMMKREVDTRNEIWDKFLENLIKAKENAEEKLKEASRIVKEAAAKALKAYEELKAKLEEATANGEEMSMGLIARIKAAILAEYQKVKPIIADLKAKAKEEVENIVQTIKDSDVVANIKDIAEQVKTAMDNFIDNIPDLEQMIKDKLDEVKSAVLEQAQIMKEKLIKVQVEAAQKLQGLIIVAEQILNEQIKPQIKAELEQLISVAEEKLDSVREAAAVIAEKLEAKIESVMEIINDKTGNLADDYVKKYEDILKNLIAEADIKIDELKNKAHDLMEEIKAKIDESLGKNSDITFGSKTDAIVDKVMEKLEKPLSKLPDSIQGMVSEAIENAIRFGLGLGKEGVMKLLDFIGDKFGDSVKGITEMAKLALQMMKKRGASEELAIEETLKALDKALAKIPAEIREWVKVMVEEALRFGIDHGKNGINILLDMITAKFGDDVKPVIDAVKDAINQIVYVQKPQDHRGASTEVIVKQVMEALEKPLANLPEDIAEWVNVMIEQVLRFGLGQGKNGINILLDMITEKFGDQVKPVIDAVKDILDNVVYGASTELAVDEVMKALEKPLEKVPEDIRNWIKVMVEEALRFGIDHGKNGINILLDMITDKFGDEVKPVIDAVKDIIDNVVYVHKPQDSRAKGIDFVLEKIMQALEKPLSKIPESMQDWVTSMVEQAVRFGLGNGKEGAKKLLDFIGEKVGGDIAPVLQMVKVMLDQYVFKREVRSTATDLAVDKVMEALEGPLSKLPEDMQSWIQLMVEQALRFGLGHGKTGVKIALDKIDEITNGKAHSVIEIVKQMLDQYVYSIDVNTRGAAEDLAVDKVMEALEKPFANLPEDIRDWVKLMIEQVLRFGITHGKTGIIVGLDKINELSKGKISSIVDIVKEMLDKYVLFSTSPSQLDEVIMPFYGQGVDFVMEKIMTALEEHLAKLPESVRDWVTEMVESAIRFSLTHGKQGAMHLLDLIGDKFGSDVQAVINMVKVMLDQYVYSIDVRGNGIDAVVEKIMKALEEPFAKMPAEIQDWVTEMVEQAIRFAFNHGKTGAKHLLDLIGDKFGGQVSMVVNMVKMMLDQYAYSVNTRGNAIDFAMEKIMSALEKPLTKLPVEVREWVTEMLEQVIKFALEHGKTGAMKLLDFLGEKGGSDVQAVIAMVKVMLNQYVYTIDTRGDGIDAIVNAVMQAIEAPLAKIPANTAEWVKVMVEEAVRFSLDNGKAGAMHLLDFLKEKVGDSVVPILEIVEKMIDENMYY